MLSGKLPFRGKTGTDTLTAILRDPTPRLSGVESSEELQHVVSRCLAKDPEERYQTTKDLLADIRRIKRDTESGVRAAAAAPSRGPALWALVAALLAVAVVVVLWPRRPERFVPRVGRTTQVTREPGLEIDAAISPDGKLVAYAAGPPGATKIYVRQVAGGNSVRLTADLKGGHRLPRWSPDGTRISFQRELSPGAETYIVPALGGAPRRHPATGLTYELVWSPDGERIAYTTDSAIFVGPADGGEARELSDSVDPSCLSWSPDGKRIAFASGNSGYLYSLNSAPSSLRVADVTSGTSERVTEGVHFDFSPVWTSDGTSLLFISDRGGGRDIYLVSLGSGGEPIAEPERLTTGLNVFSIASSADGRTISYSVATARQNIWSLPVPEDGPVSIMEARPVTTGNQRIEGVSVSADGKWLAFSSDQAGNSAIFKMAVGSSEPVQVTTGPMDFYQTWSPDGREIAFHAIRTGNRDIFIVSADGGTPRQLTNDPAQDFYPHWSPDGRRIVFHSTRSGVNNEIWMDNEIYVLSKDKGELSGETPAQLTFDEGAAPRWSPDGRLIAYHESRTWSGIKVIPSDGGEPRKLTNFGHSPLWSKTSRTIYFRKDTRPDEPVGIWSISVSGGEPKPLVRFDDPARLPHYPEWSTDGETFYFTLTEFEADVWVLELEDSTK